MPASPLAFPHRQPTNTTLTMKGKNISVLQGVCATVVFVAYFLPWAQIFFMGFEASTSFAETAFRLATKQEHTSLWYMLGPVIVLLAGANVIWQWILKTNVGAFYMNSIPLFICVLELVILGSTTKDVERFLDLVKHLGIGFHLAFIASLVSCIAAWTVIGYRFLAHYKEYVIAASLLTGACLFLRIGTDVSTVVSWEGVLHTPDTEEMRIYLYLISSVLFFIHLPFVVYGWIVFAVTSGKQQRLLEQNSAPEKTNTKTVWVKDEEEAKRYMEENNIH